MANNHYDAIVVGGGAAGLTAAIFAARAGCRVLILEQKDVLCKKLYATGNGKCNFTNQFWSEEYFRSSTQAVAYQRVNRFSLADTLSFFREIGIFPKERNGYYYPASEQAASVAEALIREAGHLGVHTKTQRKVTRITPAKPKGFQVECGEETFFADFAVLATGGMASPVHGSDGSGYILAKQLGHTVVTPLPAIVQLKAEGSCFKTLSGVRLEGSIRLITKNQSFTQAGELLFTAYGISGIPVMQVSRYATEALYQKETVTAELDLFPMLSYQELCEELSGRFQRRKEDTAEEAMCGLCNHKLNYVILKECGIDPTKSCSTFSPKVAKTVASKLKKFSLRITDSNGFANAQACAGGILLTELTEYGESKKLPGLFFVGELCDVDGTCGGYNLQWAWSSGALCGTEIGGRYASNITAKAKPKS